MCSSTAFGTRSGTHSGPLYSERSCYLGNSARGKTGIPSLGMPVFTPSLGTGLWLGTEPVPRLGVTLCSGTSSSSGVRSLVWYTWVYEYVELQHAWSQTQGRGHTL